MLKQFNPGQQQIEGAEPVLERQTPATATQLAAGLSPRC